MNRLVCFIALLSLAMSPALCATPTKYTPQNRSVHKRYVRKKPVVQHKVAVHSSPVCPPANVSPLVGQVIFEAAPPPASALQPVIEIRPKAMPEPDNRIEQPESARAKSEMETNPVASVLKACFFRLVPHRINTGTSERSWVSDVNHEQSKQLADSIVSYVGKRAAVESTSILLAPTERLQADNPLTPALSNSLRKSGFALVESKTQASNAQVLQYQVSRLDDGVWVQLHLNQEEANRFYALDASNNLVADAPFCVREVK
jgi:hypothetical protein